MFVSLAQLGAAALLWSSTAFVSKTERTKKKKREKGNQPIAATDIRAVEKEHARSSLDGSYFKIHRT